MRSFPRITDMNDPRVGSTSSDDRLYAVGALHQRVFMFDYRPAT